MLNWEMEFKKWCPAFKLLTYYGSAKERKLKRQGWSKPNAFHVCITSYTLALQDAKVGGACVRIRIDGAADGRMAGGGGWVVGGDDGLAVKIGGLVWGSCCCVEQLYAPQQQHTTTTQPTANHHRQSHNN